MIATIDTPRERRRRAAREQWRPGSLSRARITAGILLYHEERRREKLVSDHLHLLDLAAGYFHRRFPSVPFEDLHSCAYLGLRRAAEKFDPERGAAFGTCAWWWLREGIQRELPHLLAEHGVRLPQRPTAPRPRGGSLDAEGRDGSPRASRIADDRASDPAELAMAAENAARVRAALGQLRFKRDGRVLAMRFGLDGGEPMTLREVGEAMGVSVERVRQIELRALAELRDLLGE